jgi:hypothetical protein
MDVASSEDAVAAKMLDAALEHSPIAVFDEPGGDAPPQADRLRTLKEAADLLVRNRLVRFADDGRTEIAITNAGRYWAHNGGYMAFLKEEPAGIAGGGGRGRNPEMEALRSEYMRLRLNTFWWSFGLSVAGFVFSVISVMIAIFYGGRLMP